jgi:hypothetical protein
MSIIDAIRSHPDTPQVAKDQLDAAFAKLDEVAAAVANVRV